MGEAIVEPVRRIRKAGQREKRRSGGGACDARRRAAVVAAYARWAPVYDPIFGVGDRDRPQVGDATLNELPAGRILEVGVGTGISLPLYKRDHRIVGIDLSPDMLARAEKRVARRRLGNVEALHEMDAVEPDLPGRAASMRPWRCS